jgi:predicted thioesterase
MALRTGDVAVLATPRLVGLVEEATVRAVEGQLPEGTTTVGYRVQVDHLAPVPVGDEIQAEAVLETVESRRLTYRVSVTDARGLVGAGRITRVVVERDRFMERAAGT